MVAMGGVFYFELRMTCGAPSLAPPQDCSRPRRFR